MKTIWVFLTIWIARDDSGCSQINVGGAYKNYETCVQRLDNVELDMRRRES